MLGMLIFGPRCWNCSAAAATCWTQAVAYTQIFFGGAVVPWLMNTMSGILRGTGNMKLPSLMMLSSAICQIILGGTLGLGLGPIPQFGMRGVAAGSLIAYLISISVMSWYLFSGRARVVPKIRGLRIRMPMFIDILKVGADCLLLAAAVGADHQHLHPHAGEFRHRDSRRLRHRRAARIHADLDRIRRRHRLGADGRHGRSVRSASRGPAGSAGSRGSLSFVSVGAVASFIAVFPDIWVNLFTDDASASRRQPAVSVYGGADVRFPRPCHDDAISHRRARPR